MISRRWIFGTVAVFLMMGLPIIANAQDVTFQLDNVTFSDGGAAYGTFTYDFDSGASVDPLVNWNITTTPGTTILSPEVYSTGGPYYANTNSIYFYANASDPDGLQFSFSGLSPSGSDIIGGSQMAIPPDPSPPVRSHRSRCLPRFRFCSEGLC